MGPLVFGSILLTLAGSHALVSGQLIQEKCSANCVVEDGHWGFEYWSKYPNILLGIDFTPDNVMECTYGRSPTYKCRYNVTTGAQLDGDEGWCYPADGPYCGYLHPAGTMCTSSCGDGQVPGPYDTEILCQWYCHYDRTSGVLIKADYEYHSDCPGKAPVYQCGEAPETLPPRWSVAIPCAADNTGTGSAVLPGNLAVPLLSLGDGYAIKASDCIQHCARLGYPVAAVEDSTTCYCAPKVAANAVSVDPGQCQSRCATPQYGDPFLSCGGKLRLQVYKALACRQSRCPTDLTGATGTLSTVDSTVFKCSYPQGSCTWFLSNGALRNTAQPNCPKTVNC